MFTLFKAKGLKETNLKENIEIRRESKAESWRRDSDERSGGRKASKGDKERDWRKSEETSRHKTVKNCFKKCQLCQMLLKGQVS